MCGICGIVGLGGERGAIEQRVLAMRESLYARGPDDAGTHVADGVALGVRRLAILDLSERGHMPMWDATGRFVIVYNGEIYNFRELRASLESSGARFRSRTDTEVLLELFAREGPRMLPRLNGMFALAIWDTHERRLFLARDRLGVKPLYWARHDGALWFASEQKALFAAGVPKTFDPSTWEELLCFRFTGGVRTPFCGVEKLLPGHWLSWREGEVTIRRWWNLGERVRALRDRRPRNEEWFEETFDEAVALRRISDVPVGVLLSGGLDSGSIVASLAARTQEHLATFTVRFGAEGYDESALAREVARHWEAEYHDLQVQPRDLLSQLTRASILRDEPLAHVNELHLWLLSAMAKPFVTVLLSGEGADETLGGYLRYIPLRNLDTLRAAASSIAALQRLFPFNRRLRKTVRFLQLGSTQDFVLYNPCDVLPHELRHIGLEPSDTFPLRREMLDEATAIYPDEPVRQAMYVDKHAFLVSLLDRNDRMTMGASIECREPFLDYRLVEALAATPTDALFGPVRGKAMLRRAVRDRLPLSVRRHRKWGFGVPWSHYFRHVPELRQLIGMLPTLEPVRSGPFVRQRVRAVVDRFLSGDDRDDALVFQLAMIAIWHDAVVRSG